MFGLQVHLLDVLGDHVFTVWLIVFNALLFERVLAPLVVNFTLVVGNTLVYVTHRFDLVGV